MTTISPVIIGAGGIASYMAPLLWKSFRISKAVFYDGDTLEQRNLDRQQFDARYVGVNKAAALVKTWKLKGAAVEEQYFDNQDLSGHDVILCCADNHLARKACLEAADLHRIPAIIGGNDYFDSEAYYYEPGFNGSEFDPRSYYPELITDRSGSPLVSCTGAAQEAAPQLAIANQRAAGHMLHLLWIWMGPDAKPDAYTPIKITASKYDYDVRNTTLSAQG